MAIVGAIAIGFAAYKFSNRPQSPSRMVSNAAIFQSFRAGIGYASPVLIAGTIGCVAFRLRRRRPPLKDLADLPGAMAVASASLVIAFGYCWMGVQLAMGTHPGFVLDPAHVNHSIYPGLAISGAWTSLALGGRWRLVRSWIEVSGVVLGFAWLALLLVWYASWGLLR
jgi:hypothetical protein